MNSVLLQSLTKEEKIKYLLVKQSQDLMFYIITHDIKDKSHTYEAQEAYERLKEMDASIADMETSVDRAKEVLYHMDTKTLKEALDETQSLYREVLGPVS